MEKIRFEQVRKFQVSMQELVPRMQTSSLMRNSMRTVEWGIKMWVSTELWAPNTKWIGVWLQPFQKCAWKKVVKATLPGGSISSLTVNCSFCMNWEMQKLRLHHEIPDMKSCGREKEKGKKSQKLWIKSILSLKNSSLISSESHTFKCLSHMFIWELSLNSVSEWNLILKASHWQKLYI